MTKQKINKQVQRVGKVSLNRQVLGEALNTARVGAKLKHNIFRFTFNGMPEIMVNL